MNNSETNNAITLLIAVVGPIFARWGVDAATSNALIVGAVSTAPAVGAALWGVYSHWNMKKVPETAQVTK